jgi:DNA topoisomerase-1
LALQQLIHNGVAVPEPPPYRGLEITVRGERVTLTHKQEEMALAWAKKHDTDYVKDEIFVENFLADFSAELGVEPPLTLDEVDFGPAVAVIEAEKAAKERMAEEERAELRAQRKKERQELQARFGFAVVNGEEIEVANYVAEPSGIFMGRGEHPLRGRWKEGAKQRDITLNLSPDAPRPPGNWKKIVWKPDCIWVARWRDKLSGKLKYVWFSDSAPVKQEREAEKFDQAIELHQNLEAVRAQIAEDLKAPD